MPIATAKDLDQIKQWIQILTSTYAEYPTNALAKTISYYVERLMHHEDIELDTIKPCEYISMLKYWQWLAKSVY
ncbi:MAG: hypothetical protein MJK12_18780 [Colwellia sp.]|nr:hypothetical protein [Colwellia sp.]